MSEEGVERPDPGRVDRESLRVETGRRVVVRYRLDDGRATDVVGDLQRADADGLEVLPDFGPVVAVPGPRVVSLRQVPARAVRPASSVAALTRVMHRGWPGLRQARLGGWILTGSGGYTRRANCALAIGDPGLPMPRALDLVEAWFDGQALPVTVQVAGAGRSARHQELRPLLIEELTRRGYRPGAATQVLVRDLAPPAHPGAQSTPGTTPVGADDVRLSVGPEPDEAWLHLVEPGSSSVVDAGLSGVVDAGLSGVVDAGSRSPQLAPPEAAIRVLTAGSGLGFITAYAGTRAVGCLRLAVTDGWVGITAMRVVADHRRRGIASAMLGEALAQARSAGAGFGYLQVADDNPQARALYDRHGFTLHHHYRYWTPPAG
ncbi:MAG: GNAT family N-acetyltransferase [Actinomycetales bacterium]